MLAIAPRHIAATAATVALLLGLPGAALAATSGTIRLSGTVAAACTISVSDAGASLDLTDGETSKTVGTVVETCNSGSGYTVTVSSANSGSLKSSANGASPISYTLKYDSQSGALNSAMQVIRSSAQFNKQVAVAISVPATANAVAGTYSDTLTLTIAAR